MTDIRLRYSTPWLRISSWFHGEPTPTPKIIRPFDSRSRVATCLASQIGSRCTTRQIPVPIRRVDVTAAIAVSVTNCSRLR